MPVFQDSVRDFMQDADCFIIMDHNYQKREVTPIMTQEEKLDALLENVAAIKAQLDKQDEQIDYIVKRLNHMRDKAHSERESKTSWPK